MAIDGQLYDFVIKVVDDRMQEIRVTREEFDELRGIVKELAEAQHRTELRLDSLAQKIEELAEAQRRTELRVDRLAEKVEELAEAQRKTEVALQGLTRQVGALSDTIGFGLEDVARLMLPPYLERHLGVNTGELELKFFTVDGEEVEVNLYGEGTMDGE